MPRLPASSFWIASLCFFLSIALQVQTTFFYSYEAYKGLRICLADMGLPFIGLALLISLLRQKSLWPAWPIKHMYWWLAGLTIILVAALIHTYLLFGQWSFWGITNKIPGMAVICSYFCLGGWLATNASENNLRLFFKGLFAFFLAMMTCELGSMIGQNFYHYPSLLPYWPEYPLKGFMDNRNVYVMFILVLYGFLLSFSLSGIKILPRAVPYIATTLLPYFLMEIGSRAGFIAAFVMLTGLAIFYRQKIIPFLGCLIIGTLLMTALYIKVPERLLLLHYNQMNIMQHVEDLGDTSKDITEVANTITYMGDNFRLQVLEISKDMIVARPILGSGLGSSFIVQKDLRGTRFDVIESTPLWLWVETGLIGLLAFGIFYILCVRQIWARTTGDDFYAALSRGAIIAIAIFTIMTCLHELMYTRQIWFFLGLALALPAARTKT